MHGDARELFTRQCFITPKLGDLDLVRGGKEERPEWWRC
jgi:hypothetical protein